MRKKRKDKVEEIQQEYWGIVENISSLNMKYIKFFIDLFTHKSVIDAQFFIDACAALTDQYNIELAKARAEAQAKTDMEFYMAGKRTSALGIYSWRRWFRKYDSPAKEVLNKRVQNETQAELEELREGIEPFDYTQLFISRLVDVFVPPRKRNRFIKVHKNYLTWILDNYALKHSNEEIFETLLDVFAPTRNRQRGRFIETYSEFLESMIADFVLKLSPSAPKQSLSSEPETQCTETFNEESDEEPKEEDESEEDELDELQEFEDQLEHVNAIVEDVDEPGEVELDHEEDFEEEFESEFGEEEKNSE